MGIFSDIPDFIATNKGSLLACGVLIYLAVSAVLSLRTWYSLRHFKGPFWAAFSKWWLVRHVVLTGTWHLDAYEISKKYGKISRIGPEQLLCSDPDIVRRYLAARSPYTRSDWYLSTRFDPEKDNIESTRSDERHAWLRSRMAAGFSGKENENLEETINKSVMKFMNLLETKYISTDTEFRPMDFAQKALFFTIDTITEVAYGTPFGCLTTDSDVHDYMHVAESMIPMVFMISIFPWLNSVLQWRIAKSFLPSEADPVGVGKIKAVTKQIVAERFGPDKKVVQDMMGSFIRHGLNQEEVESEMVIQLAAGTDTSAVAIRATFLYIITNPRVLSRLRADIATLSLPFAHSTATPPISYAQALTLPYLQAVIKEGLRLFPPITALCSKQVPEGGDVLNGVYAPAGTRIGWCSWGMLRDRDVFGEDAELFRPERWLIGEGEGEEGRMRLKVAEDVLGLVFSYGKHSCLGKNVALMELNKVYVELLRRFNFEVVNPGKPWEVRSLGVYHMKNMWLRVTKRKAEEV